MERGRSVLEGAFVLMKAIDKAGEASLTALASASRLPRASAYRPLAQLVDLGAVEKFGIHYRVGAHLYQLGGDLGAVAGATITVSVLRNGETITVATASVEAPLVPHRPGVTWPWAVAAGKALVAVAPPSVPLDPLPGSWQREATQIREHGAAIDRESLAPGVFCTAVPPLTSPAQRISARPRPDRETVRRKSQVRSADYRLPGSSAGDDTRCQVDAAGRSAFLTGEGPESASEFTAPEVHLHREEERNGYSDSKRSNDVSKKLTLRRLLLQPVVERQSRQRRLPVDEFSRPPAPRPG